MFIVYRSELFSLFQYTFLPCIIFFSISLKNLSSPLCPTFLQFSPPLASSLFSALSPTISFLNTFLLIYSLPLSHPLLFSDTVSFTFYPFKIVISHILFLTHPPCPLFLPFLLFSLHTLVPSSLLSFPLLLKKWKRSSIRRNFVVLNEKIQKYIRKISYAGGKFCPACRKIYIFFPSLFIPPILCFQFCFSFILSNICIYLNHSCTNSISVWSYLAFCLLLYLIFLLSTHSSLPITSYHWFPLS